jgi:hypothetical protein
MRTLAASLIVLLALPAVGSADEAADRAQVTELFKQGNDLLRTERYAGALEKYRAAYALIPSAKMLANMGLALRNLGQDAESLDVYERYLRDTGPEASAATRASVTRSVEELRRQLGRVTIHVSEPGAIVRLDGVEIGASPLESPRWLKSGPHRVEARKEGFGPASEVADVKPGTSHAFRLRLERVAAEAPPVVAAPSPPAPSSPAPRAAVEVRRPDAPEPTFSHRGRLGAITRFDIDAVGFRGGAVSLGATYGILDLLEVGASAVVGSPQGGRAWATLFVLPRHRFKPTLVLGVPVFLVDGTHVGAHGGAGLQVEATRTIGISAEVAVEHVFGSPARTDAAEFKSTFVVPSVGAQARW